MINGIVIDDEPLAHRIINNYCGQLPFLNIAKTFHSALEAVDFLHQHTVDLVFLDINMPKLSGLAFLRSLSNPPMVIITTAYQEHALESYELDVVDYLLKPFSFERFIKAVNKVQKHQNTIKAVTPAHTTPAGNTADTIFIKEDKRTHQVAIKEIRYLEGYGSYVKVHLKERTIVTLDRLTNFEGLLPRNDFIRIHRSYIVAVRQIRTIDGNQLLMQDITLPIGSVYKHKVNELIRR